jgi:hypothetical protein
MLKTSEFLRKLADENKKHHGVSPWLVAGVPALGIAGLGLKAAIPAARMAVRKMRSEVGSDNILRKLFPKEYAPKEFVRDYIESGHQIGKSPLNTPIKEYIAADKRKKEGISGELWERAHWDAFANKDKNVAMDKWVDELKVHAKQQANKTVASGGRTAEQAQAHAAKEGKKIDQRYEQLKGITGTENIAENLDKVDSKNKNHRLADALLTTMAVDKAGPAKTYGTLGLAGLGTAGVGAALTGKGIADQYEMSKDAEDDGSLAEMAAGAGGAGALGLALQRRAVAKNLEQAVKDKTIGVTAGYLTKPHMAIGAGHATPMEEAYKLLGEHPAIASGEFNLEKAIRKNDAIGKENWLPEIKPGDKKHWIAGVEGGWGADFSQVGTGGMLKKSPVWISPHGEISHIPDPLPKNMHYWMAHGWDPKDIVSRLMGAKRKLITYGPDYPGFDVPNERLLNVPDINPLISRNVSQAAQEKLHKGVQREEILKKLIAKAEEAGDHRSLKVLKDTLENNKKLFVVSGASRGDFVAQRAVELEKMLKERGHDNHNILALMAGGKGTPAEALLNANDRTATMGKLDQSLFTDAQDLGDVHWGPAGGQSMSESSLSRTPFAFNTNNAELRDREIANITKNMRATGKTEEEIAEAVGGMRIVDLDNWNPGNIDWVKNMPPEEGMVGVRGAGDVIALMEKLEATPEMKQRILDRVERNLGALDKRGPEWAAAVVDQARESMKHTSTAAKINRNLAKGLGVAGGLTLTGALIHHLLRKRRERQASQHKDSQPIQQ